MAKPTPAAPRVHLAYKAVVGPALDRGLVVEGRRLYAPLDLVDRLGASSRIASWRDGRAFEAIGKSVALAHDALLDRLRPLTAENVAESDPRFVAAMNGPSFQLEAAEFGLLCDLVDHAGDADAFDERYAAARFLPLELRLLAPIFEALCTPLAEPTDGDPIPS